MDDTAGSYHCPAPNPQGYLAAQGEYLFYPYLSRVANGVTAMTFGIGGPSTVLSAVYAVMGVGSRSFGPIRLAAGGTTPDNGFTGTAQYGGAGRWGDYSAGELIPGTNRLWLATQYLPNAGDGNAKLGQPGLRVASVSGSGGLSL